MGMRYTSFVILSSIFIVSCGGGGGGGTSGILGGPSGGGGTTYTYKTVEQRIDDGTLGQYDIDGVAIAQTYNAEKESFYRRSLSLTESNISFSTGTNSSGEQYYQIDIDKYQEFTLPDTSTPNVYNLRYSFNFTGNQVFSLYNYPSHVYIDEFYSNASLIAFGIDNPLQWAGVEYVDSIMWWMNYDNGFDDYVAFVFGDTTFAGDMPTTSSATYDIKSMGFAMFGGVDYIFTGSGAMNVNFSSMTLSGSLDNNFITDDFFGWSQIAGYGAGSIEFNGTISGSDFSGDVVWAGDLGTGFFTGNFFGPNAAEIGGSFDAFANEDGYNNWIVGTFLGAK